MNVRKNSMRDDRFEKMKLLFNFFCNSSNSEIVEKPFVIIETFFPTETPRVERWKCPINSTNLTLTTENSNSSWRRWCQRISFSSINFHFNNAKLLTCNVANIIDFAIVSFHSLRSGCCVCLCVRACLHSWQDKLWKSLGIIGRANNQINKQID